MILEFDRLEKYSNFICFTYKIVIATKPEFSHAMWLEFQIQQMLLVPWMASHRDEAAI